MMLEAKKNEIRQKIAELVFEFSELNNQNSEFEPGKTIIPPSGKLIDHNEMQYMVNSALDGWLTSGRFNTEFEKKLANFIGVKHG